MKGFSGLKSETLMENSGDKGFLSGGVRVSEESNIFSGESNRGAVINATERKSIESGDLKANDRHGVSNNRISDKVSPNNRWESWGVMNMVGRVLGGKLCMDNEIEDVNDSENWGQVNRVGDMNAWPDVIGEPVSQNQGEVNQVADMNAWQDVIGELASENQGDVNQVAVMNAWQDVTGEPTSASGIGIKEMDINSDYDNLDLGCPVGGNSLNGNQDLVFPEIDPDGRLEYEEINYVGADVLIPKGCGSQDLLINEIVPDIPLETEKVNDADLLTSNECGEEIEKVGEYNVSDLVWGKVKSHPWWPGQIFAASAASDKAKKYFKKESYLVAYFGDESFAWNEGSKLMPFRMHFSEMEKQSGADGFSHAVSCALDETARRVELGLSCPCLAQEVRDEIKFQIFENAGIHKESSIRSGGDSVSDAARFSPGDALQFIESLAKCPQSEHERLQVTISKVQLLAYTRWKGSHQLPVFEEHIGLLEDDTQFNVMGEGNDSMKVMEGLLPSPFSDAANDVSSENRKLMAKNDSFRKRKELLGDEECPKLKEKSMSVLMSSESSSLQRDYKKSVKRTSGKVDSSTSSNSKRKRRKTLLSTGAATSGIDVTLASNGAGKSQIVEIIPAENPTPDVVLSKLTLAAKKPMQGHDAMIPAVGWLREFRDSVCLEKSGLADQEEEAGKHKREQPSQTADIAALGGSEDSYWTDRIIQSYSQDQTLFGSQKPYGKDAQLEADVAVVPKLDDDKEIIDVEDLDTGNLSAPTNVVSDRPTAFTLRFKSLDSIPSVENLNEIFSRFGGLYESETKILVKSKSAKVIFKRPVDAETAFSSAGKYSIFGSSLVSYRLRYVTTPLKSEKSLKKKKKKKKGEQEQEGTSQKVDAV